MKKIKKSKKSEWVGRPSEEQVSLQLQQKHINNFTTELTQNIEYDDAQFIRRRSQLSINNSHILFVVRTAITVFIIFYYKLTKVYNANTYHFVYIFTTFL